MSACCQAPAADPADVPHKGESKVSKIPLTPLTVNQRYFKHSISDNVASDSQAFCQVNAVSEGATRCSGLIDRPGRQ